MNLQQININNIQEKKPKTFSNIAAAKVSSDYSWSSETGNTTKSDSVDMEEEYLVEETSFDYGDDKALTGGDSEQTPKSSKILTKKALGKPLGKINFLDKDSNDILLDILLTLPLFLKTLVDVPVRKSFVLDIGLDKIINGFRGAFTSSKFSGIIRMTFTSELGLIKATKKTTVLKEIPVRMSAEAVHAALSKYGVVIKQANLVTAYWSILIEKNTVRVVRTNKDKESWDAKNHHKTLLYTLPIRTNAHNI
ncbi:hypothetical protein G9A89_012264 [Geosiphon pyriformis]|nr:hypothetical protein G9A89_012264 [Geosiphon pyriformis]